MAVREGGTQPDWVGRGIGLVVFFTGIVLLVVVFVLTNTWLGGLIPDQKALPKPGPELTAWLAAGGVTLVVRFAQLFILGLIGAWIAGRGAQLYAAANRAAAGE